MMFTPFGAADKIKLSVEIVQNLCAVPTKSGKTCSTKDAVRFMMLCQAQRLNPFAGDAYLVGYDGQNGATFSLITAHVAFLKRAETCPDFEGMESGVILLVDQDTGETKEREGDFHLRNEIVVGGWAKVFRKGRKPTYRRIRMERFNNGFAQWKADAAGMIVKCAESDALRSTFPSLLGGMFNEHEIIDVQSSRIEPGRLPGNGSHLVDVRSEPAQQIENGTEAAEPEMQQLPPARGQQPEPAHDAKDQLATVVRDAGFSFEDFVRWATESGNIEDASSLPGFEAVSVKDATRLLRARAGLIKGLQSIKAGGVA